MLTKDQQDAVAVFEAFYADGQGPVSMLLEGGAGVGKTYLLGEILRRAAPALRICATPTHKAMGVLRRKLDGYQIPWEAGFDPTNPEAYYRRVVITATVAQLLGKAPVIVEDQTEDKRVFAKAQRGLLERLEENGYELDLIVIDEVSMVSAADFAALEGYAESMGARILAVGDAGQLPPVEEDPIDFEGGFVAGAALREVVRQAEGSPIVEVAWAIREGRDWGAGAIPDAPGLRRVANITRAWLEAAEIQTDLREEERRCFIAYTNRRVDDIQDATCWKLYGHGGKEFAAGELVIARASLYRERGRGKVLICSNGDELIVEQFDEARHDPVSGTPVRLRRVRRDEADLREDEDDDDDDEAQGAVRSSSFWASYLPESALEDKRHPFNVRKRALFAKARDLQGRWKQVPWKNPQKAGLDEARKAAWHEAFEWADQTVLSFSHPFAITSHKSQGSTYREVYVDAMDLLRFERRALYVAVTRPAKLLVLPVFEQLSTEGAVDIGALAPPETSTPAAAVEPGAEKEPWIL